MTENSAEGITFEKFLLLNYKYLRAGPESLDRMIFDIFDLSGSNLVTQQDLSSMLLTLPSQAIISGLNAELKGNTTDQNEETKYDSSGQPLRSSNYQYRVIRAP